MCETVVDFMVAQVQNVTCGVQNPIRTQRQFHTLDVGDHEIDDSFTLQITDIPQDRRQFHISDLSEYSDPRNQQQFHTLDVGDYEIDDSFTVSTWATMNSTTVSHFRRPGRRNRRQFHTLDVRDDEIDDSCTLLSTLIHEITTVSHFRRRRP